MIQIFVGCLSLLSGFSLRIHVNMNILVSCFLMSVYTPVISFNSGNNCHYAKNKKKWKKEMCKNSRPAITPVCVKVSRMIGINIRLFCNVFLPVFVLCVLLGVHISVIIKNMMLYCLKQEMLPNIFYLFALCSQLLILSLIYTHTNRVITTIIDHLKRVLCNILQHSSLYLLFVFYTVHL